MARRTDQTILPVIMYDTTVRFYFDVEISCLIPRNPRKRRGEVSDAAWTERQMERVEEDLMATLNMNGLSIAYRKHEVVDDAHQLYVAHFVVSIAQNFTAAEGFTPRKGYVGFSVRSKRFRKAKATIEANIRDKLKDAWVVRAVSYEYAAAWQFVYEVTMEGTIELRHVISKIDIDDADGSVRQAIENFNDDVASNLEDSGFIVTPRTITRRPKDNIYKFDVCRVEHCGVYENEVSGNMALLRKGADTNKFPYFELKNARDSFGEHVKMAESLLEGQDFSGDTELVRATLDLADYDEDIFGCSDFLVY